MKVVPVSPWRKRRKATDRMTRPMARATDPATPNSDEAPESLERIEGLLLDVVDDQLERLAPGGAEATQSLACATSTSGHGPPWTPAGRGRRLPRPPTCSVDGHNYRQPPPTDRPTPAGPARSPERSAAVGEQIGGAGPGHGRPPSSTTSASAKATRRPPETTEAVHSSTAPTRTGARKLVFISTLEENTFLPRGPGEGDGGRPHGRVGHGPDEPALDDAGRIGEPLVGPHPPHRPAGLGLVDAGHPQGQLAVGRDLDPLIRHRVTLPPSALVDTGGMTRSIRRPPRPVGPGRRGRRGLDRGRPLLRVLRRRRPPGGRGHQPGAGPPVLTRAPRRGTHPMVPLDLSETWVSPIRPPAPVSWPRSWSSARAIRWPPAPTPPASSTTASGAGPQRRRTVVGRRRGRPRPGCEWAQGDFLTLPAGCTTVHTADPVRPGRTRSSTG